MSLLASCKSQLMTRDRDLYVDRDSGAAARRGGLVCRAGLFLLGLIHELLTWTSV